MDEAQVHAHLLAMSDAEVLVALELATKDVMEAAANQPDSEWHQTCFAGAMVLCIEMERRCVKNITYH